MVRLAPMTPPPPSDRDKASILATALAFHLRVAEIAADIFPTEIKSEVISGLVGECRELGQSLSQA